MPSRFVARSVRQATQRVVPARTLAIGALAACLAASLGACGESFEAGTLDGQDNNAGEGGNGDGGRDNSDDRPDPEESPEDDETPDPSPDPTQQGPELDVCDMVPPERVQQLLGRDETPQMNDPNEDAGDEDESADMPGIYRCSYRWEPGETTQIVRMAASGHTGNDTPEAYVASMLGEGFDPVDGVGEVAGMGQRHVLGEPVGVVAAARTGEHGVEGVLVEGPTDDGDNDEGLRQIAGEFFDALDEVDS